MDDKNMTNNREPSYVYFYNIRILYLTSNRQSSNDRYENSFTDVKLLVKIL